MGADPFGDYVRAALENFGVDTTFVVTHPHYRTPLAFAAMESRDEPTLIFYREPAAPDEEIKLEERHIAAATDADVFWVAGSCLSGRLTGPTVRAMLEARARKPHTVLDLDYRPSLWRSEQAARDAIASALDRATVAVGNSNECQIVVGTGNADDAADALLARGVDLVIVKLGAKGVLVATRGQHTHVKPVPVDVVSGLGAGDAFGGAFCWKLLTGAKPVDAVRFANAAGAVVASRLLCADAMPSVEEVQELLETATGHA